MDASREELSSPSSKADELSGSSPQRDAPEAGQSSRPPHFDLLARHQSASQVSQSDPDLFHNAKAQEAAETYNSLQWAEDLKSENVGKGSLLFSSTSPVCSSTLE